MELKVKNAVFIFGKLFHKDDIVTVPDGMKIPTEYEGAFYEDETPKKPRKSKEEE